MGCPPSSRVGSQQARSALILSAGYGRGLGESGAAAVTVVVRRPGPPLAGLVKQIVYRTGEQSRTSVEKISPGPGTGLWVNLNRDAFRSFG